MAVSYTCKDFDAYVLSKKEATLNTTRRPLPPFGSWTTKSGAEAGRRPAS